MLTALLAISGLAGCTHLKGVVLEDPSGHPMQSAVLSVGRPGGIAVFETHPVDSKGRFDFSVMPTDLNDIYLYDAAADPEMTVRHVDESEMNDHMQLHMQRARAANPMIPMNINVNQ